MGSLLGGNLVKDLESIKETIQNIFCFFHDAERRESTEALGKGWLSSRLREVLYDADDLFDVIATRAFRKEKRSGSTFTKEVRLFFSKSNQLGFVVRTAHDVKHIKEGLDDIYRDMRMFNFMSNQIEENPVRVRETHSYVRAEDVIGRDQERDEILNLLLSEGHRGEIAHQRNLSVISIIGFSGLGKTTLAQLVFNDNIVQFAFDLCLWACVKYFSDLSQALIAILESVCPRSELQGKSLELLQQEFRSRIGGKKYLLVLDGVCDESSMNYFALESILRCGKSGSMVLATVPVANAVVARCLSSIPYQLSVLSEESALSLFEKIAFRDGALRNYSELVPIGEQIVRQTGYVPHTIVKVGRMLRHKPKEKRTWLSILENPQWKDIEEHPNGISKDISQFNFMSNQIEENPVRVPGRTVTHSFVRAKDVIGRGQEREEIINLLLSEDHLGEIAHQRNLSVISIIGFSGLGKTTLAQLVFNDERVQEGFDLCLWACVNYFSDLRQALIAILERVHGRSDLQDKSLELLQREFRSTIGGKKYLLVLDDVCDESSMDYFALENILRCGRSGSMVLATVPNTVVARCLDSTEYQLKGLSEESAWDLFRVTAFEEGELSDLVPIGKQIVRQTEYAPYAIVKVGSMLRGKPKKTWLSILDKIEDYITLQWKPSYNQLHPKLKRCFAYCSLLRKDYTFDKDELIRLWLAQGFLDSSDGEHLEVEEVGDGYFDYLVDRGFLGVESHARKNGLGHKARIREFLQVLATEVAGGECECLFKEDLNDDISTNITLRHVSIHCDPNLFFEHFRSSSLSTKLRTLLFRNTEQFKADFTSFVASCRALRTLQLSHLNLNNFPDLFGELIHLRYLDLSYNWNVEALPNSICDLYHLQTLKLEGCVSLKELPSKFRKLVSLRHLLLDKCNSLASLPSGLAALSSLVTLDRLIVHHHDGGLRYLNSLNNLRGALTVEIPVEGWPNCIQDARDSDMSSKPRLKWTSICWIKSKTDSAHIVAKDEAREVLNALKPHDSLEYMNIDGYVGEALSSWVFSLPNVKQLFLTNCTSKYLDDMVRSDTCLSLETLEMNSLTKLKGWWKDIDKMSEVSCLPCVSKVVIKNCPTLVESMPLFVRIKSLHLLGVNVKLVEALLNQHKLFSASSSECRSDSKLEELQLYRVEGLSCLPSGQIKCLTALKRLSISGCNQLDWVSRGGLAQLTALETLSISDCRTVSLEDQGNESVKYDKGMPWKDLGRLRDLTVPWQRHLQEGLSYLTALERLEINYWNISQVQMDNAGIEGIGILKGLKSLSKLKVRFSDEMKSCFPRWIQYLPFLEDVEFCNCKELSLCWTTLMIKMRLRKLNFTKVEKVTIVDEKVENPLNRLSSLEEFYVSMTDEEKWIHSIPWNHFSSLRTLSLHDLPNFMSLPSGIQPLTSLQQLICCDCSPKLKIRCTRNGADWALISRIPDFDIRGAAMETTVDEKPPVPKSDHPQPVLPYSRCLCSCFQPPQIEEPNTLTSDVETRLKRILSNEA